MDSPDDQARCDYDDTSTIKDGRNWRMTITTIHLQQRKELLEDDYHDDTSTTTDGEAGFFDMMAHPRCRRSRKICGGTSRTRDDFRAETERTRDQSTNSKEWRNLEIFSATTSDGEVREILNDDITTTTDVTVGGIFCN